MNLKVLFVGAIIILILWIWTAPQERFGYHTFGFTTYSSIPFPYFDLKIHADGSWSIRGKSHFVSLEEVSDLADENPDVLIIGTGYDELVGVDEKILNLSLKVEVLETSTAIERFNELKDSGKRVSVVIHSTC